MQPRRVVKRRHAAGRRPPTRELGNRRAKVRSGYDIANFFRTVRAKVNAPDHIVYSAHCHDDLGLAVANTLAAVDAGVRQVECTINGIGERAGNAALEEIVMAFRVRADQLPYTTAIETTESYLPFDELNVPYVAFSSGTSWQEIANGLELTGHFLMRDLLTDRSRPMAEARERLVERLRRAGGLA